MNYLMQLCGNCLGPAVPDGEMFLADPTADISPLALCHVVLKRGTDWERHLREAWSQYLGAEDVAAMCKVFLDRGIRDGREVLLLGQFYPAAIAVVPVDCVEAMHRLVGLANSNIEHWERAREMFRLIAWARGTEASQPINSDWRPPLREAA